MELEEVDGKNRMPCRMSTTSSFVRKNNLDSNMVEECGVMDVLGIGIEVEMGFPL